MTTATRLRTGFLLLALLPAGAQQAAAPVKPAQKAQFNFATTSTLVVEDVTITDKSGNAIAGLAANDFTVTEDGIPQKISVLRFQQLAPPGPPAPVLATRTAAAAPPPAPAPAAAPPVASTTGYDITPDKPGDNPYDDKRLMVLYFDMTAMPVPDQLRALDYSEKFVRTQMGSADMLAIIEYAGEGVKVKQDFTANKDTLLTQLDKLIADEGLGFDETTSDADSSDTGSAFGQDDSEFNIFNTNRQLAALQTAVNMLASLKEKKAFVYFSSGLNLNGLDNQAQLASTINSAIRANVAFDTVDARGLVAMPPMGDASTGSPGGASMYNGGAAAAQISRLQTSQNTIYSLAEDTGGKPLLDNNDLGQGIVNAEKSITSYYILGYYTTNKNLDGKYRKIKIVYNANPNATLAYRVGYYGGKVFAKFTDADKERQLEDALMLGDPITDITMDLEVNYFELDSADYFIPVAVKIPGSELELARKGGAEQTRIDFIGELKDEYGTTITNLRDLVTMKLTGESATELARSPIVYTTGFTVLPGKYTLKLLARDDETGRIGTFIKTFTVPNLAKVATDPARAGVLPISTVVLSSQRVPLVDALFNAKKDVAKDAQQLNNPLVQNGAELIPSVTRVFRHGAPLYVYLQAYERPFASMQPLVAFVAFYQGAKVVYAAPPQPITTGLNPQSKAIPVNFTVDLGQVPPGRYNLQVTVTDPNNNKAGFNQTPILIVP